MNRFKIIMLWLLLVTVGFGKNILALNSYHPNFAWTHSQMKAIGHTLQESDLDYDLYMEFMDTKRFRPTKGVFENLYHYYSYKYKNTKFDVVITTDDNALNFVRKYKNTKLFKDAKVFFCGVNNLSLQKTLDTNIYAGVFEKKDPIANYELAKRIDPKLKTIYLLFDNTVSANKIIKEYKSAYKNIKDIKLVYINSNSLNYILDRLKNYEPHSIAMALTITSLKYNGDILSVEDDFKKLITVYKNPLLVHSDVFIKYKNVVGGNCVSGTLQGKIAAQKALMYLHSIPMKDIGLTSKSPNQLYFNMKNVLKFNLDINKLNNTTNAVIINKPVSFYEVYKTEIVIFVIISLLLLIFTFVVMKKNYTINALNDKLQHDIEDAIEQNTKQLEILQQQSKMAQMGEMIGAIAHQWRQPLNAITTSIQNLKYDYKDGNLKDENFIDKFIEQNKQTIKFMSNTIDDFRSFFRVDKEKKDFNIKETTQAVINMQLAQLESHNIKIGITGDETQYNGLQSEYQQVVLNIINNAKDALIENNIPNPKIDIILEDKKIYIQDNAGGIPQDILNRVFEPYFTTKEQGAGTGMGLYMSKMIIEDNMHGLLTVENISNGARFCIDLNPTMRGGVRI